MKSSDRQRVIVAGGANAGLASRISDRLRYLSIGAAMMVGGGTLRERKIYTTTPRWGGIVTSNNTANKRTLVLRAHRNKALAKIASNQKAARKHKNRRR